MKGGGIGHDGSRIIAKYQRLQARFIDPQSAFGEPCRTAFGGALPFPALLQQFTQTSWFKSRLHDQPAPFGRPKGPAPHCSSTGGNFPASQPLQHAPSGEWRDYAIDFRPAWRSSRSSATPPSSHCSAIAKVPGTSQGGAMVYNGPRKLATASLFGRRAHHLRAQDQAAGPAEPAARPTCLWPRHRWPAPTAVPNQYRRQRGQPATAADRQPQAGADAAACDGTVLPRHRRADSVRTSEGDDSNEFGFHDTTLRGGSRSGAGPNRLYRVRKAKSNVLN